MMRVIPNVLRKGGERQNRRESEKHYMGKTRPTIADFEDREEVLGAREFQKPEAERGLDIDSP